MKRAWEVGTLLFDACKSMGLEGCGHTATIADLCECEKKAADTMCAELEYAWTDLCPKTNSHSLHQSVCNGQMMEDSKTMCRNLETLPGVLVNHWPLAIPGLSKIDDKYVHISLVQESAPLETPRPPPAVVEAPAPAAQASAPAPPPSAAPPPPADEGGDEGGVASGMDASDY
eukprot:CAMPEP_0113672780 /NCGR_PEP_ID=MMETSP0038_2-20120614/6472_1 /TAXON_ID=2898 /ORGANISM="Cryptomonas paramecium" /LENGTH=172 /DNA_ID=CAMNT_0000589125 /DNA_START=302 /DNA_END=820 /DNA_ORIENTATION=- /assembly_acc=CAM_ASM_000170